MSESILELERRAIFPTDALKSLSNSIKSDLNALQRRVVEFDGFLAGRVDALISAPTASGKTLIAELAALTCLARGKTALYLVPTRALAEEKTREFQERYGELGIRVVCSTRDYRRNDELIRSGQAPFAVAVYEKAHALFDSVGWGRVGLIVADEVQLLGEPERGAVVDLLLTRWKKAPPDRRPQLVALSAVLSHPEDVAKWLDLKHFTTDSRPIPLREGVFDAATGIFHWRDAVSGETGEEELVEGGGLGPLEGAALGTILARLAEKVGPALLFQPTRREAYAAARAVADTRLIKSRPAALDRVNDLERGMTREWLQELLPHGVALHTADMPLDARRLVEEAFDAGEIRLLVATPTLEQGVNLRAATVLHAPEMLDFDPMRGAAGRAPLSRARFQNQGGRAGRRGMELGRSMLLCWGRFDRERAWRATVTAPMAELRSPVGGEDALESLAAALGDGPRQAEEVLADLLETYGGRRRGRGELAPRVEMTLAEGVSRRLWRREASGHYRLTALGETVSKCGVRAETAQTWATYLDVSHGGEEPRTALLFLVALAAEWESFPLGVNAEERRFGRWPAVLRERLRGGAGLARSLAATLDAGGGTPYAHHRAARLALLLDQWVDGVEIAELEEEHHAPAGHIHRAIAQASWLTLAAAETAAALGAANGLIESFLGLAAILNDPDFHNLGLGAEEGEGALEDGRKAAGLRFLADDAGAVEYHGERFEVTPYQYRLLYLLAETPGRAVKYETIISFVWEDNQIVNQAQISFHRKGVEDALRAPRGALIGTRHGWGLKLLLDPEEVVFDDGVAAPSLVVR